MLTGLVFYDIYGKHSKEFAIHFLQSDGRLASYVPA